MPTNGDSVSAKIQSFYRQLSTVAADLNAVSDELGKPVADLDAALKKLNLGVSVWTYLRGGEDPQDGDYWGDDLGYAKIGGKWGVAIRSVHGNVGWPDQERSESWLFNDAPRELRLVAIGKIPDLLEKLHQSAVEMTQKVRERLTDAQEVAAAVKEAAEKPKIEREKLKTRPVTGKETASEPVLDEQPLSRLRAVAELADSQRKADLGRRVVAPDMAAAPVWPSKEGKK